MSFGGLELHGHFDIFVFLGVNRSGLGLSSTTIIEFIEPWDDFMVHGVTNPLINNYPKFGAMVTLGD